MVSRNERTHLTLAKRAKSEIHREVISPLLATTNPFPKIKVLVNTKNIHKEVTKIFNKNVSRDNEK